MSDAKILVVHRWGGTPESDWYPWLKQTCQHELSTPVIIPQMPETEKPNFHSWVAHLQHILSLTKHPVILVGHSIGCQTILRYLAQVANPTQVKGVILVAPWLHLSGLSDEEKTIAEPWLTTPIDFENVKSQVQGIKALFSDNDYYVPLAEKEAFEQQLNLHSQVLAQRGHFTDDDGVKELPELLSLLKDLLSK